MAWNDLTLSDKARMIQLAVNSGITNLKEIQEVYNTFDNGGLKETKGTDNPFEYARGLYTTNTMTEDFARELNDSVRARNFGFSPETIAYVIGTESGYNVRAKNPASSARGILQLTKPTLQQMYGSKKGEAVYNQYINNTRKQSDQIHDAMVYLQKRDDNITTNRQDMSAGRLKANLLAPNSAMASPMSKAAWASLTAEEKQNLSQGKATYNDFARIFNTKYTDFLTNFAEQKPKQKKSSKKK